MKSNYKVLMKEIGSKDEVEQFTEMNRRIDDILSTSPNQREKIEALICYFEGKNNTSSAYAILGITYAVSMTGVSIVVNSMEPKVKIMILFFLITVGLSLAVCAYFANKNWCKYAFIIRALKIRREDLLTKEAQRDIRQEEKSL